MYLAHFTSDVLNNRLRTARPGKVSKLQATYPLAGDRLQVYEVADLSEGEFPEIFKGELQYTTGYIIS